MIKRIETLLPKKEGKGVGSARRVNQSSKTYRALKLGTLAASALDNVLDTDFGIANLLLGLARDGIGSAVAATVPTQFAVGGIVVGPGGARSSLLGSTAIGTGGSAAATTGNVGRRAASPGRPRCGPRGGLDILVGRLDGVVVGGIVGVGGDRGGVIRVGRECAGGGSRFLDDANVDGHIV